MAEDSFQQYKSEMREYLVQYRKECKGDVQAEDVTTDKRDIVTLLDNMRRTFPNNPAPDDRIAMCYAYFHRSFLMMEEPYYQEWRDQAKKYIRDVPAEKYDNNLLFAMSVLDRTKHHGSTVNNLEYAEKAVRKMTIQGRKNEKTQAYVSNMAKEHYDFQIKEIDKNSHPQNNEEYQKQLRRFERAVDTLVKIPHTLRYAEMNKLLPKIKECYYMTEAGRIAFDGGRGEKGKWAKVRHRVYASMPAAVKANIKANRQRNSYAYK